MASHLVCDVDVRRSRIWNDSERRRQAPTLQGNGEIVAALLAILAPLA